MDTCDIARLTAAFDAALVIAHHVDSPFRVISESETRAWVARSVLAGMRRSIRDSDHPKALALRDLHLLLVHEEESALTSTAGW